MSTTTHHQVPGLAHRLKPSRPALTSTSSTGDGSVRTRSGNYAAALAKAADLIGGAAMRAEVRVMCLAFGTAKTTTWRSRGLHLSPSKQNRWRAEKSQKWVQRFWPSRKTQVERTASHLTKGQPLRAAWGHPVGVGVRGAGRSSR